MGTGCFTLTRPSRDALRISLRGELSEADVLAFEHALRSRTRQVPAGALRVLVDLCAVQDYSLPARQVLVRCLEDLSPRCQQVLYVADGAGPRALALWVARMGTPGKSRVVTPSPDVQQWLSPEHSGLIALVDELAMDGPGLAVPE